MRRAQEVLSRTCRDASCIHLVMFLMFLWKGLNVKIELNGADGNTKWWHRLSAVGFWRKEMANGLNKFCHVVLQEVDDCIRACIEGIRYLKDWKERKDKCVCFHTFTWHMNGEMIETGLKFSTEILTKSSFLKLFSHTSSVVSGKSHDDKLRQKIFCLFSRWWFLKRFF